MLNTSIANRIRRIVAGIHGRDEMINVHEVAQQILAVNGGHDRPALAEFIAQEAIRLKGAVCWDDTQIKRSVRLEDDAKLGLAIERRRGGGLPRVPVCA